MRAIEPPNLRNGRFEIPIETEGRLALPPELVRFLGLEPGDIAALEPLEDLEKYVKIRFYRQILTFPLDALSLSIRWSFIVEMLRLPLTALDEGGALWIPPRVLRLRPGDRPVLSVTEVFGSSWPSVELSEPKPGVGRGPRSVVP
jgi:hypothetical protein